MSVSKHSPKGLSHRGHKRTSATRLLALACGPLMLGLVACADASGDASGDNVESLGGTMVLEPGGTGLCRAAPCTVQFRMPPGSGSYEVLSDTMSLGTYPAGETVTLGSFYNGHTFNVKGAGVAPAYFHVQ